MQKRAQLTVFETIQVESRGIPTSYGIMTLTMPDGKKHQFNIISGGFGRGAAPGMHDDREADPRIRAAYDIYAAHKGTGDRGMRAGGADFFITVASPARYGRGLTLAELRRGESGALGIHPDGDSKDMRRPLNGGPLIKEDGRNDDGTNGCWGISSADAKRFQDLYFSLPESQRPTQLYMVAPPRTGPVGHMLNVQAAITHFPNVGR